MTNGSDLMKNSKTSRRITLITCSCAVLFVVFVFALTCVLLVKYFAYTSSQPIYTYGTSPSQSIYTTPSQDTYENLSSQLSHTHGTWVSQDEHTHETSSSQPSHTWVRRSDEGTADVTGGKGKSKKDEIPANATEPWELNNRLEPNVVPILYDINLNPALGKKLFTGIVDITVNVFNSTNYIYLHKSSITIEQTKVYGGPDNTSIELNATFEYTRNEYFVIKFKNNITPGIYKLSFQYKGNFSKKNEGFYESAYVNFKNHKRLIATSKFEPTYARQAFPCFDEPSMKAKFLVKLVKPKDKYIALSNMNVKQSSEDTPGPNQTTVEFEVSVPMSTYLVCFIVCDFNHLPSINSTQGFPINVYAREGQLENMKFAQDIAVNSINFYIEYFGINYPLPKLDLIAIPDFVSGAMEHWGLVTFREASVLFKQGSSSVVNMKRVAMTTAHELAHMWFGDLVTMGWWNDLWLNEGFASFMQYKALARVKPEWEVDTMFLTDTVHSTLQLDQTLSSHPIVQTVSNPDQITEIFDIISYQKGSSVIRMLENMMGEGNFSKGVNSYLQEFKFKNAETNDLWSHLQKHASDMSVTDVMDTYTRQMGFPLITAKKNTTGDKVTFTQERYLANPKATYDKNDSPFKYTWDVYITMTTSAAPNQILSTWLYKNMSEASISIPANTTWIKVNSHQVGYFRVNYEPDMWKILIEQLETNHTVLDARDRSNLLDDAFNLAESQQIEYSTTFSLMKYLTNEDHYVPWTDVYNKLSRLDDKLYGTDGHDSFQKYIRCLLKDKLTNDTWVVQNKTFLEVNAKIVLNDLGCNFGMKVCLKLAEDKLKTWLETGEKPDAELRGVVYRYGMENAGPEMWDKMWIKFKEETNPQEQMKMLGGLGSVKDVKQLEKFLEMAKEEKNIRSQDYFTVIMIVSNNPIGLPVAWTYLQKNWEYLVKRFSLNHRVFGRIIPTVCGKFKTEDKLKEVQNFFTKYPEAGAGAAGRKQAVEMIQNNIKWLNKHGTPLAEWLKNHLCKEDI